MQEMWQCRKLRHDNGSIQCAEVIEMLSGTDHIITAKLYVICAGAVLTPQIFR